MSSPQLEGRPILCFAHDWGGDPTSKTHIMRILSRRNRVLWIESIGMRRPAATARDLRRVGHKLARALSRCREAEPNLFVASPLVLPFPGWPLADRINATILSVSLRRLCRRLGLERPILWSFMPNVVRLLGSLDESGVVYHCVDEYAAFTGVPRRALLRMEQELARRADLVLTSSETLRDERRALNPNTHFVTHGVDVRHFGKALDEATEIPKDLRDIRRPVVGFFGLLADWVDFNLLREAAGARPDLSFVLLGKEAADLGALRGFRNVHLLGRKQYEELPAYCRGFDVGIIPFRWNALTVRANPLKLREYLAAGLPVVATPLPEVARYRPHVRLAEGPSAFLAAIDAALGEQGSDRARARAEVVRAESWEKRVAEIETILAASGRTPEGRGRRAPITP